jgi:hypothetical protein
MKRKSLAVLTVAAVSCTLALADDPSAAGHWEGAITLPSAQLEFMVDLDAAGGGTWSGEIDIPEQGIRNFGLTNVSVDGDTVVFSIPDIPGAPTFTGTLAADGESISGSLNQSGQDVAFTLARKPAPEEPSDAELYGPYEREGVPGKGLAGTWRGLLSIGPAKARLVLNVGGDDGSYAASLDSVDQGAMGLEVDELTLGEDGAVGFVTMLVNAAYDGTLNDDGSEISGRWQQGGQEIPLTFRRAGAE